MRINIQIEDATPEELIRIIRLFPTTVASSIQKSKPDEKPTSVEPKIPIQPVLTTKSRNRYGIPTSLYSSDKKMYCRLWYKCKSQGIRYEEALLQEGVKRTKKEAGVPRPTAPVVTPLSSELKLDTQVRQTGGSKIMDGIGRVVKIHGNNILVRFDNGMDWMQRKHITVVTEA
jgi:hypothetical protein